MELRHLRYFVAVAETRHFGNAATRLCMAQPPLSQAIQQLEADLGVELLSRTTRRVNLTGAGEAFYEDAERILRSVDDATRRVRLISEGAHGVLRLGLTGLASYRCLPEIARVVQRDMPGVALEVHSEMLTPAQEESLLGSTIDVGILRPPTGTNGIAHRGLTREPLVLALSRNHWLADEPTVNVGDLRIENFVMYSAGSRSVVNEAVVRSCLAAGFYPRREHEGGETSILLGLVAAGLGVALVPESVRAIALDGVVIKPVHGAESVDLALAWNESGTSPLVDNLLSVLETNDFFREPDDAEDTHEDHRD